MKRLPILAVALLALGTLTACVPIPGLSNNGFTKARWPNRTSVNMANPSNVNGYNMVESVNEWNFTAGWRMIDVYPQNDAYGNANADIRFSPMSPIIDGRGGRHAMWVQEFLNADRSVHHCVIHYDPEFLAQVPEMRHPDVISHEVGHCLGWYTTGDINGLCDPGYQGVMSYCRFNSYQPWWENHPAPWWGADDQTMLANAGYRW
ncbi:MAG: hypothetical protein K0R44_9 [Thermomicrobiales bacterium]|jgi:hypothetical protein|nr:hypothetical protein [Thermomicrobiales bacterium]MDF3014784.1 hypothetical protein [Thermomicrobiales bacterium]